MTVRTVIVENVVYVKQQRGSLINLQSSVQTADIFLGQDTYGWPEPDTAWAPATPLSYVVTTLAQPTTVPTVVGLTPPQISIILAQAQLVGQLIGATFSSSFPVGVAASQSPSAGTLVNIGYVVQYLLSLGPAPPPPFLGYTEWQARAILADAGFVPYPVIQYVYSLTVPDYYVVAQSPPVGTLITSSQGVQLTVSMGPPNPVVTSAIPNVVGKLFLDAQKALVAAQCAVASVTWQLSSTVRPSVVISQSPAAGVPVTEWTQVSLVVASGPPIIYPNTMAIAVPNVVAP